MEAKTFGKLGCHGRRPCDGVPVEPTPAIPAPLNGERFRPKGISRSKPLNRFVSQRFEADKDSDSPILARPRCLRRCMGSFDLRRPVAHRHHGPGIKAKRWRQKDGFRLFCLHVFAFWFRGRPRPLTPPARPSKGWRKRTASFGIQHDSFISSVASPEVFFDREFASSARAK